MEQKRKRKEIQKAGHHLTWVHLPPATRAPTPWRAGPAEPWDMVLAHTGTCLGKPSALRGSSALFTQLADKYFISPHCFLLGWFLLLFPTRR